MATRGSPLARWQAARVAGLLANCGIETEVVVITTTGDTAGEVPLHAVGGQGIFVTEVQAAVVAGEADLAVHSAKDLPASWAAEGLVLASVPERADRRDVVVGVTDGGIGGLPRGALVATGAVRRRVQLRRLRPDLRFTELRGNLGTRLAVAGHDGVDAVVAARAAVDRLGWRAPDGLATVTLGADEMLSQVGQGALAVECRTEDADLRALLSEIDDGVARCEIEAERAFLGRLGGGCTLPVAASATVMPDGSLQIEGMVAEERAGGDDVVLRVTAAGDPRGPGGPAALGSALAERLAADAAAAGIDWPAGAHP
jgi:hydroxymethylbilane synthase